MARSQLPPLLRVRRGPVSSARQLGWGSLGVMVALALRAWGLPLPLPGCPLRALTGIPCPTCFLTRSALATLHGDLGEALELHLFGPPLVVGGLWLALVQGLLGRPLPAWPWGRIALVLVVAVFAHWFWRLAQGTFPVVLP